MRKIAITSTLLLACSFQASANEGKDAGEGVRIYTSAINTVHQFANGDTVDQQVAVSSEYVHETAGENFADAKKRSPWALSLWGTSYHPRRGKRRWDECNRRKPGGVIGPNECNWGIGIKYKHELSYFGEKHYSEINYFKNSFGRKSVILGTGMSYEVLHLGDFGFSPAISLNLAKYEIYKKSGRRIEEKDRYMLAPIPGIILSHASGVDLNIAIVPHLNKNDHMDGKVEVWGFYLTFNFDPFFRKMNSSKNGH